MFTCQRAKGLECRAGQTPACLNHWWSEFAMKNIEKGVKYCEWAKKKILLSLVSIPRLDLASGYPAYARQAQKETAYINGNDRSPAKKRNAAIPWTVQAASAAHSFPVGNVRGKAHYNQNLFSEECRMGERERGRGWWWLTAGGRRGNTVFKYLMIPSYNNWMFRPPK